MATTNLLTNYTGTASYVAIPGQKAVSIQVGSSTTQMLVEAITIQLQRPVTNRHFLNAGRAAMIGKGSCTVTIQGLFAKASDISEVFGTPTNLCQMEQTIKVNVTDIASCDNGNVTNDKSTEMTLKGCIADSLTIETSLTQDGALYQRASVRMTGHSAEVEAVQRVEEDKKKITDDTNTDDMETPYNNPDNVLHV